MAERQARAVGREVKPDCLLSVDVGKHLGWARFRRGFLFGCGVIPNESNADLGPELPLVDAGCEVVIEKPQVYVQHEVDPNDLVDLAVQAGFVGGWYGSSNTTWVLPRQWKGQVPKSVTQARVLKELSQGERDVVEAAVVKRSVRHNLFDAIGIGLWKLGRYK